jgi:uncharacterized protein (TIGR02246 family)
MLSAVEDLGGMLDAFCAAFDAQDPERLRGLFAGEDASLVTTDGLPLLGREQMEAFFEAYAAQDTHFSFNWDSRQVHDEGEVGWVIAFGQEIAHRPDLFDVAVPFRMTLLCRRGPGGWRINHLHASTPA